MAILRILTVYENQKALKFTKGRLSDILEPGRYWLWARQLGLPLDIFPATIRSGFQEAMTEDGATLRYQPNIRIVIRDLELAFRSGVVTTDLERTSFSRPSADVDHTYAILHYARLVSEALASRKLEDAITNQLGWTSEVNSALQELMKVVGLEVIETQVCSLTITGNIRAAYGDLLKAQLEARSSLERARNEATLNRSLLNTARLVRENPGLMELRLLMQSQKPRINFVMTTSSESPSHPADESN